MKCHVDVVLQVGMFDISGGNGIIEFTIGFCSLDLYMVLNFYGEARLKVRTLDSL